MDYLDQLGALALASRLRRLLNGLLSDGEKVYRSQKIDFAISWFPIFHILAKGSPMSLTDIAKALGVAHPSVIEVTDEMTKKGYVGSRKGRDDKRRRYLFLTEKGEKIILKLKPIWEAFREAGDEICGESGNDFLGSIGKLEKAMARFSMYDRISSRLND
ncbi:MAG: winged helix-turn-helix transcriptional regulator [candidate division Zixibacteria bacterium]|nr:winged helix-turn-helix transcriptional regulator [candidate division Zixibacteria bacterium]